MESGIPGFGIPNKAQGIRNPINDWNLESNYWAACAPSHKMGFRSSVSKSGLPGEGRHEGLVSRNDVLTNGFIGFSLARTLAQILFVPRLRPPRNPQGVANLKKAICVVRSDSTMGVTL